MEKPQNQSQATENPDLTQGEVKKFSFHGSGDELFKIWIQCVILTALTLGVYYFWAKIRIRKYIYSRIEFDQDRFEFLGTPLELFRGWVKAFPLYGIPIGSFYVWVLYNVQEPGKILLGFLVLVAWLWVLLIFSRTWSFGYRLNRLSWRGIRFSFRGKLLDLLLLMAKGLLLSLITFGVYYPRFKAELISFRANHSYFGSERFHFDGKTRTVYTIFQNAFANTSVSFFMFFIGAVFFGGFFAVVIAPWASHSKEFALIFSKVASVGFTIFLFGLFMYVLASFIAEWQNFIWNSLKIGNASFNIKIDYWDLFTFKMFNFVINLVTVGLAWPWIRIRDVGYLITRLGVRGSVDYSIIAQEKPQEAVVATGDELIGFFKTGFDLGIGP